MTKYTVKVVGMQCSMCEAHVNDAVRRAFQVKKVTSSHRKGETVILSETPINEDHLRQVIDSTGYTVHSISSQLWEKRGPFSFFGLQ